VVKEVHSRVYRRSKQAKKFEYQARHQESLKQIKISLTIAVVLAGQDFTKQLKLKTDGSELGIGAVLTQEDGEGEHTEQGEKKTTVR